ncbi:MAG TPA: NAD(P)H-dependent oxidoreductase [Hymenobacter sp.]|jgi:NAD(P)H-dependent FMN reductase
MKIAVIYGSARPGRSGETVANWVVRELSKRSDIEIDLVDAAALDLPYYNEPNSPMATPKGGYNNQKGNDWAARVGEADGFIFVAAEYNHGYTALLKNAIDWVHSEWFYKPAAFVSYGAVSGGIRAAEQLTQVVAELRMFPLRTVSFPAIWAAFDADGEPVDASKAEALSSLTDELLSVSAKLNP